MIAVIKATWGRYSYQAREAWGRVLCCDEGKEVVPQVTLAVEHYNRIFRLLNKGMTTRLNIDLKTRYTNEDGMEHNIIAEIPGTDLADEVVMFGAHFDSWHTGTGATDNGAGSGCHDGGCRDPARDNRRNRCSATPDPETCVMDRRRAGPDGFEGICGRAFCGFRIVRLDFHSPSNQSLKKYPPTTTSTTGTGKIRGVYLQGNENVAPVFRDWLDLLR